MCQIGMRPLFALAATAALGCNGDYQFAKVNGTVTTCEGAPAAGGTIVFYPIDDPQTTGRPAGHPGREARATVGDDGSFQLTSIGMQPMQGAVTGRHRVEFFMPPTARHRLNSLDTQGMSPEDIKKWQAEIDSRPLAKPIPCDTAIAPSEVTVVSGENNFEFTLPPKK